MHELGLTTDMLDAIEARMSEYPGKRVRRVVLEIGRLSAVLPYAMRFCFELCSAGTVTEGATLEIVEVPAVGKCRACSARVEADRPYAICACGSADLDWVTGQELKIRDLEID